MSVGHFRFRAPRYGASGVAIIHERELSWSPRLVEDRWFIRLFGWDLSFVIEREVDA